MKHNAVLISGASGYIGMHLTQKLRKEKVTVLTATRDWDGDLFMDFSKPKEVASIKVSGVDTMIHAVSPNETLYKTDPYRALAENATGIHAALDFCVNNNIKNFIYLSSFHVFGKQTGKLNESTPVTPCNDYGLAHYTAEQTVQVYARAHQIKVWIVRSSNVYGVPLIYGKFKRENLIPFQFCREAVEKNTITLLTSGAQRRNFVGVSDVCDKIMWVLKKKPTEQIFHAYGNETMSVFQYAQLVQNIARDYFDISVEIIRPPGQGTVEKFHFSSLYHIPELVFKDNLSDFVLDMFKLLLSENERIDLY